jgi:hypothetical protein
MFVEAEVAATPEGGSVTVTVCEVTHPFTSVMVHVYDPALRPEAVEAFPPAGAHAYVYAGVPPAGATLADPSLPPKQVTLTPALVAVSCGGSVIVIEAVPTQPVLSVTVTV